MITLTTNDEGVKKYLVRNKNKRIENTVVGQYVSVHELLCFIYRTYKTVVRGDSMQLYYPVDPGHSLVDGTFLDCWINYPSKLFIVFSQFSRHLPNLTLLIEGPAVSQIWIEMVLVSLQERDSINV